MTRPTTKRVLAPDEAELKKETACLFPGRGTSFAAAHTAGLAALITQQMGRRSPAAVRARILQTADDLGSPGVDPYYGNGRINVARALGVQP